MGLSIRFELHIHINRDVRNTMHQCKMEKPANSWISFISLAKEKVENLRTMMSRATIDNYLTALRSLHQYLGNDIALEKIDSQVIKGYERWLRDRKLSLNTISCYMRSLRSLYSKIECGFQTAPFDDAYTGKTKTEKKAITEEDITRLKSVHLYPNSFLSLTRDLFLFSFYAQGMPFVDMAFLRSSQIRDGQLIYHRHKTGQRVTIHLEPCMLAIISQYQRKGSDYVFPLLCSDNPQKAYDEYLLMLNRYNHTLKTLAKKARVTSRLTSYTARHTWASIAFSSNVDLPVISKALGHTNTQTTMTYIKEINDSRLEEANRRIINMI